MSRPKKKKVERAPQAAVMSPEEIHKVVYRAMCQAIRDYEAARQRLREARASMRECDATPEDMEEMSKRVAQLEDEFEHFGEK